ncbi:hypothetical protein M2350_000640 [Candidatus Fervidibacter sacchari]|uniref:Uncharacterized protein n=1 Tax=Candidatus Fervidibacter sacchari TaxID=1448929 RepID=A0ABT2EJX0_9BACT|nr:hypothetical protein [Candidatus Fervidibacter sacchari]
MPETGNKKQITHIGMAKAIMTIIQSLRHIFHPSF